MVSSAVWTGVLIVGFVARVIFGLGELICYNIKYSIGWELLDGVSLWILNINS